MPNADYQSIYRGTEMDDRWGKAGTAVQGVKINGTEVSKDAQNKVNLTLNKAAVGLGNVNNTSDADKPVSTAVAAAIAVETTARQEADAMLTASINAETLARQQADAQIDETLANKANKDGYYEQMGVGVADNLAGKGDGVPAMFTRRPTGGTADVADGVATLKAVKGNTIVWNQLSKMLRTTTVAGLTCTKIDDITVRVQGTATGQYPTLGGLSGIQCRLNHYYYTNCELVGGTLPTSGVKLSSYYEAFRSVSNFGGGRIRKNTHGDVEAKWQLQNADTTEELDMTLRLICIDLTQMFGAGNEPTTVAEFEALFPNSDYAYNAGQLLSLNMTGIKTDGFNQWDEEWELGIYSWTGQKYPDSTKIRSKNLIPVFQSTTYFFCTPKNVYLFFYDSEKNFISYTESSLKNTTFTTPSNARYMTFYITDTAYGTTYNHDICINLSHSGVRNGEYEPYWTETRNIPVTTIKGKVNGEGASVVIFPDGMRSAGTAHDEIVGNKVIKRIGVVDLGSLTWSRLEVVQGVYMFNANIQGIQTSDNTKKTYICSLYLSYYPSTIFVNLPDKSIKRGSNSNAIYIRDDDYTDAASFKAAMQGVMLYYELAEPVEYIIDESDVPNYNYKVSDFGTETLLPEGVDASGVPKTSPIKAQIVYGMNAVDTLRNLPKNYISKESMNAILSALQSAGIIAGYTLTYNASTGKYECEIVAPTIPE